MNHLIFRERGNAEREILSFRGKGEFSGLSFPLGGKLSEIFDF